MAGRASRPLRADTPPPPLPQLPKCGHQRSGRGWREAARCAHVAARANGPQSPNGWQTKGWQREAPTLRPGTPSGGSGTKTQADGRRVYWVAGERAWLRKGTGRRAVEGGPCQLPAAPSAHLPPR